MLRASLLVSVLFFGCLGDKPSIIMVLTDDQDVYLGGSDHQPKVDQLLKQQGVSINNMFATTPVCCPSRSSFITGRYLHNIHMTNNSLEGNCSSTLWQNGPEKRNIGTYMSKAGYKTAYLGKYLNQYGDARAGGLSHIPPGWTFWNTLKGNSRYYNYSLSVNGKAEQHGSSYHDDYLPDLLANRTLSFLQEHQNDPVFVIVATPSCHDPTEPAPQYANSFEQTAPRTPNYGKFHSGKNWFVDNVGTDMPDPRQQASDWQYKRRLDTLLSVDDMVERLVQELTTQGKINNTYFFYSSDHGYHLGQFGLMKDKRTPYEFDIRIPGYVRGPGIPAGKKIDSVVTLMDFAPTFLDIAGVEIPQDFDGESMLPKLQQEDTANRTFLIEYHGEQGHSIPICKDTWQPGMSCYLVGPDMRKVPPIYPGPDVCSCQDDTRNTYECIRTLNGTANTLYCKFVGDYNEFYHVDEDPWQKYNAWSDLSPAEQSKYQAELTRHTSCVGKSCNNN